MSHSKSVHNLRILAIVEGISLLSLFFIAMPLKYYFDMPQAVTMVGWVHGVLFMGFVFQAVRVGQMKAWSESFLFAVVLSSMIPFGMVYMDKKLKAHV